MVSVRPSMIKRFHIGLLILAAVILFCVIAAGISVIICSFSLAVRDYDVKIEGIRKPFTAVLMTDLHSKELGRDNETLLAKTAEQKPDVIFVVGDMIDSDATDADVDRFVLLLEKLQKIAPVYCSYGNHEQSFLRNTKTDLASRITETGAILLNEECITTEIAGNQICMGGTLGHLYPFGRTREQYFLSPEYQLLSKMQASGLPTIVLAHLPDTIIFAKAYNDWDIDLFLSGHTHGGVIRIPGFGGVYAPMQGWFPNFDKGYFNPGKTQLVISGGMAGYDWIPRIFNRPEICVLHIH